MLDRRAPRLPELPGSWSPWQSSLLKLVGALLLLVFLLTLSNPRRAEIQVVLLGDLMLGRGVAERLPQDPTASLALLAGELQAADLALGNLESPLTSQPLLEPDGYDLRASPASAAGLAAKGLDVLSLANNHSLDSGQLGLADTRAALAQAGLAGIASGDPPYKYKLSGIEVAVLAYEAVSQPLDWDAIAASVRAEKESGSIVIVSLHWGGEFRPAPEPSQREAARMLAEAGADLIWGHHPHVLQPVEWIERPPPYRPSLVVYSLGNALFDQEAPPDARWGALLVVRLDADGVREVNVRPFEINLRQAGLQEADPLVASRILERLQLP